MEGVGWGAWLNITGRPGFGAFGLRMEEAEDSAAACSPGVWEFGVSLWVDVWFAVADWFSLSIGNLTTPRAGRSRARLLEAQIRIKPANFIVGSRLGRMGCGASLGCKGIERAGRSARAVVSVGALAVQENSKGVRLGVRGEGRFVGND
jgi:hypothetical protein